MKGTKRMYDELKRLLREIEKAIKRQERADGAGDKESFEEESEILRVLSERLACKARKFSLNTYSASKQKVYDQSAEILGIKICKEDKKVIVELPFLLPRKKDKDAKFVGDPLRHKFEQICEKEDLKIREKVVVCIIHTYDNVNKKAKCYDFDNLECKRILDIITVYTLTDDSPKYIDVYQTVRMGDKDKTRIVIMPADEFWEMKNI